MTPNLREQEDQLRQSLEQWFNRSPSWQAHLSDCHWNGKGQ